MALAWDVYKTVLGNVYKSGEYTVIFHPIKGLWGAFRREKDGTAYLIGSSSDVEITKRFAEFDAEANPIEDNLHEL